ncbi:MAG: hypothetical protein IPJ14_00330 [Kineosporiaceae bacterium]|nr:hypothetical protein [Kineosporiaceae bacterium]
MNEIPGVSTVPTSGAPDVALLIQTDELLDRIGRRMPVARDLDDPVLASLAVLAADVDLAPVSLERTRRAAVQRGLWPPDVQRFGGGVVHRDAAGDSVPATQPITLPRLCPPDDAPVASPAALIAPQRTNPGAGGTRRAERSLAATRRPVTIRVVPGLVAAGAALVLSMTAAAALTRGESVNPAAALVHVVREMSDDAPPARSRLIVRLGRRGRTCERLERVRLGVAQLLVGAQRVHLARFRRARADRAAAGIAGSEHDGPREPRCGGAGRPGRRRRLGAASDGCSDGDLGAQRVTRGRCPGDRAHGRCQAASSAPWTGQGLASTSLADTLPLSERPRRPPPGARRSPRPRQPGAPHHIARGQRGHRAG